MVILPEMAIAAWWASRYAHLTDDLGLDRRADHEAALLLGQLLAGHPHVLHERDLREDRPAVVIGAADTVTHELAAHPPTPQERIVVADGALSALANSKHNPDLIVSDLDGDLPEVIARNAHGVPVALHAHGDNQDALRATVPRLHGPILPTRQTPGPVPTHVFTPGGFGDGDRAVFLAHRLGAPRVRLIGFDLDGEPGALSHQTNPERKREKMRWSAILLSEAPGLGIQISAADGTRYVG